MIVAMEYRGRSDVATGLRQSRIALAANRRRDSVLFRGELAQPLLMREALAALQRVVISDLKYHPKDRLAFRAWLEEQDRRFLANLGVKGQASQRKLAELQDKLSILDVARLARQRTFLNARGSFLDRLFGIAAAALWVFDPVVAVHPDEISFEALSRDESTYARLAARRELFHDVAAYQCGTTNIDFSPRLHRGFERLRTYRSTALTIDPGGVTVTTGDDMVHEKKIDLPDRWIMGFLQVQSTMTLGLTRFHMAPVDFYNICRFLRRHKTRTSPRALRYELIPGQPVRAVLEPWDHAIELTAACPAVGEPPLSLAQTPGALYQGNKPLSIRTWGRDRLQLAVRLLPMTRRIDVYLAGHGLPTIYIFDLGPLSFTLALSGWTDNDWTGGAAFDLLSRRLQVNTTELAQTFDALRAKHVATEGDLAMTTGLGIEKTRSALSYLCQVGRAMYDLTGAAYRHRELFAEPFTVQASAAALAAPSGNPQENAARQIVAQDGIRITSRRPVSTGYKLTGSAMSDEAARVRPLLHVDHDGRVVEASCTCRFFLKHKLTRGPCEHILALRLAHMNRLEREDREGG